MKINAGIAGVGNVDQQVQTSVATVRNAGAVGQALDNLGGAGENAAAYASNVQARDAAVVKAQTVALGRAKASNALLDHELAVKQIEQGIKVKLESGQLPYTEAEKTYQEELTKIPAYTPDPTDPVTVENYGKGLKRVNSVGSFSVQDSARTQMKSDYKAQGDLLLDGKAKLAGTPGSDIDSINSSTDEQYRILAHTAGELPAVTEKKLQDFKDKNWYNQAANFQLQYADDKGKLLLLRDQLNEKDGFYTDRVDSDRRTALSRSIDGRIEQLDRRAEHASDRLEVKAGAAIGQIEKQISSGIPGTAEDWLKWGEATKGTTYEADFKEAVNSEIQVQKMLRMPMADQANFIQDARLKQATDGASVTSQANLNRLQKAFDGNQKLLRETPLVYNANTTGIPIAPLDFAKATTPEGMGQLAAQVHDRFVTVNALRKQQGPEVALNPFTEPEMAAIKGIIGKQSTGQEDINSKLQVLGMLSQAAPDALSYAGGLKAIGSDSPIFLVAGAAAYRGLQTNNGRNVARTLMEGDKVLADKSVPMPTDAAFASAFSAFVGSSMQEGTPARQNAYTAFKAAYAGMAADKGVHHSTDDKVPNDDLVELAANMVTGGVYKQKVVKPYGWTDDKFEQGVNTQLEAAATANGYDVGDLADLPLISAGREGVYYLQSGSTRLAGKDGKALTINVSGTELADPGSAFGKVGREVEKAKSPLLDLKNKPAPAPPTKQPRFSGAG